MYKLLENNMIKKLDTNQDIPMVKGNNDYDKYLEWIAQGNTPEPMDIYVAPAPTVVAMRQARLALLEQGLLVTVDTTIASGTDEAMKIDWEYATEVRRDWASLITMATSLGMTNADLDNLFLLASTK